MERIYGIREGSHGEKRTNNVQSNFTQEDLAELDYPTRMK